jgi:hypothetical protein
MPLIESASKEARSENIGREVAAGKPPAQAAAIAYSTQRANQDAVDFGRSDEIGPSMLPPVVTAAEVAARNRRFWGENAPSGQGLGPDELFPKD